MNDTTGIETTINEIAQAQGWEQETVEQIAYGFILNVLTPHVQEAFVTHLRQMAHTENDPVLDQYEGIEAEEIEELDEDEREEYERYRAWVATSVPDFDLSAPLIEQDDPFAITRQLRRLGCAVAVFTPEELTAPDGTGLDDREIEEAMVEAGNERISFLIEADGLGVDDEQD